MPEKDTSDPAETSIIRASGIFQNDQPRFQPEVSIKDEHFVLLLASTIHDIKGQITSAMMSLECDDIDDPSLHDEIKHELMLSLRRAALIADQALTMRGGYERKPIKKRPIDILKLIKNALGPFEQYCAVINLSDTVTIYAEEISMARAILNLVDNALKYGGMEKTKITIIIDQDDDWQYIRVMDNGPGLPPDNEELFSAYKRGSELKPDGYGIGLASTKIVVDNHEGEIYAENNIGYPGCTFTIKLPKQPQAT